MSQLSIAIIGAGFSGTLLSLLLQSSSPAGTRIYLIERTGRFATGVAYGSINPNHLLNVPAGRMSAFPDRPLDFLHCCSNNRRGGLAAPRPPSTASCRVHPMVPIFGTC